MTNALSSDRIALDLNFDFELVTPPPSRPSMPKFVSMPPRPQVSVENMRETMVEAAPQVRKASRRWIFDLFMVIVGSLAGIYVGSAPVRAYVARAAHGHFHLAMPAASAAATLEQANVVSVANVSVPLTPDLNRTASGAAPIDSAAPAVAAKDAAPVAKKGKAEPASKAKSRAHRIPGHRIVQ